MFIILHIAEYNFFFYKCHLFIDGPRIVNGRNSSCWKVDKKHLACTCLIQSLPKPTVKWKINGRSINVSNHMNGKVSIFTERSNSVTNSTLFLPVNTEESQNIQCVASNKHGKLVLELFNETGKDLTNLHNGVN